MIALKLCKSHVASSVIGISESLHGDISLLVAGGGIIKGKAVTDLLQFLAMMILGWKDLIPKQTNSRPPISLGRGV